MAKLSIVIPVYNVEKYLRQCLDSIVNQTLRDIEIICVNDGSTDSSLAILREYAANDARIKVIDKPNSGYGNSMNQGFELASGEYIGIIESDDYAELDMFERLYLCASEHHLDACKSGYYYYYTFPEEKNVPCRIASAITASKVFCPTMDFSSLRKRIDFFGIQPTIWSAIYKRDFIQSNHIRFRETPGASFQDTSFNFKVWALAKRVKLMEECFLHYRQDNTESSVQSSDKVFCICEEFAEISAFLNEHPHLKPQLELLKTRLKYDAYIWNYARLNDENAQVFIQAAAREFSADLAAGTCSRRAFPWYKWRNLKRMVKNPIAFHEKTAAELLDHASNGQNLNAFQKIARKLKNLTHCVRDHGFLYTVREVGVFIGGKLGKQKP